MGEGRNAFFLAKMGYEVEGFDVSQTAIERCIEIAKKKNLKVKAEVKDLRETNIPKGRYSLIIAALSRADDCDGSCGSDSANNSEFDACQTCATWQSCWRYAHSITLNGYFSDVRFDWKVLTLRSMHALEDLYTLISPLMPVNPSPLPLSPIQK